MSRNMVYDFLAGPGFAGNPFTRLNAVMPPGKQGLARLIHSVIIVAAYQLVASVSRANRTKA